MELLVFTLPGCSKCDRLKEFLQSSQLTYREYDVSSKEGRSKIRDYIKVLRRDESGAIIIPTLIVEENGVVAGVLNAAEELEEWLKSRA
ncbi:MAG TPA: glutaredoxin [Candidatus Saccharicenans sp.]|jgi:glutaredoxin|nr:glutaredoxin [Candidatus Saccharicenans sp.]HOP60932.1 glutaredoxin [Candidatus Saccharicenans sp.]HQM74533.1 glutaredoxin [Candidatus Saccharicenans sp.]